MVARYGGRIDYDRAVRVEERRRNLRHVFVVVHGGTLAFESFGQLRTGAVVAGHMPPLVQKITGEGAHADATDAQK